VVLPLSISYGESRLLVSWCEGDSCGMTDSDEDRDRNRRPGAEDRGWSSQVGYSVAGRSRGRVTLCALCIMHKETRSTGFLVWPQNQGRHFLPFWPQNRWLQVSQLVTQNHQLQFGDLGLKITAMASWFGPQNQAGNGLLVAPQNRWNDEVGVGHTSRSSGLLRLEVSQARVSQSSCKTGGGTVRMVHAA
jgi:hypothetical protein